MASSEKTVSRAPCSAARRLDRNDLFEVSGKVADGGIDLGKRDLHNFSLICRAKQAMPARGAQGFRPVRQSETV